MSEAYKCDRCNKFGEGKAPNMVKIENSKGGVPKIGDEYLKNREWSLCPECSQDVRKILENPEISLNSEDGTIMVEIDD